MKLRRISTLSITFLLLCFGNVFSQTVHTITSLADSGPGTLREAFTNALWDDTLRFDVRGVIRLTSGGLTFDKGLVIEGPGSDSLTIHGDSAHTPFTITQVNDDFTMSGLSVKYGNPSGLTLSGCDQLYLEDVVFEGQQSSTTTSGGGMWVRCNVATLRDCNFLDNSVRREGSDINGGGAYILANELDMEDCEFEDNSANSVKWGSSTNARGKGGGLYLQMLSGITRVNMNRCSFYSNSVRGNGAYGYRPSNAFAEGSGFYLNGNSTTILTMDSCTFVNNSCGGSAFYGTYLSGAAFYVDESDSVSMTNCTVSNNDMATNSTSRGAMYVRVRRSFQLFDSDVIGNVSRLAGGMYIQGTVQDSADIEIRDCLFDGNGHISGQYINTGGLSFDQAKSFTMRRCRVINSTLRGLKLDYIGDLDIRDCEFYNSGAEHIYTQYGQNRPGLIQNCSFVNGDGYAIHYVQASPIEVKNCTFVENNQYMYLRASSPKYTNCIFSWTNQHSNASVFRYANEAPISGGGNVVRNNRLATYFTQPNDINNLDPRMVSWGFNGGPTQTYTFHNTSPGRDLGGMDTLGTDQRGFIRDSLIDSGAWEFGGSDPGTVVISNQSGNVNACAGDSVSLSISAIGSGVLTYQWQYNSSNINGANQSSLSLSPVAAANSGNYTCLVTNGSSSASSSTIVLTINDNPVVTVSGGQTLCAGQGATISASGGLSYSWNYGLGAGAMHTVNPLVSSTYVVTVTDANTCSSTDSVTVTVNALPNANAGQNQSICLGQSANLNATGGNTYNWNNNLGSGASHAVSPANTTTYQVTVTDANSCSSSDSVTVTVNPLPTANAGQDQAICSGQSVTLTASGGGSYTWSNNLGSGASHTVSPGTTTSYSVTVTDGNSCTNTDAVTVTVNPLPTANAGQDQSICAGQSATLTASGGGGYAWSNNLGSGASHTVSPGTTTNYSVTVTNGNNCSDTDVVTVTVNPLPNANAGQDQSICVGQSASLSASGGNTYTWNNGLGNGASHAVSPTTTTTYTVTVTDGNSCSNTDAVTVTVNSLPTANAGQDQSICLGQSATLSASGGNTYTWDNGLGSGASHTVSPATTTNYSVTVTNGNNCSDTDVVTVTVNPLPNANAGQDQSICVGQSASLSASGGNTYMWSNGLGSGASQSVSPVVNTTYTVTVTDGNNCSDTDAVSVTVNPLPSANAGQDQSICAGQSAILSASGGTTYSWNNGLGSGASHAVSPVGTTTYSVTVTDANTCSNSDSLTVTVNALPIVSFIGLDSLYCTNDPAASLQGTPLGGTFSGTGVSGNTFDPNSAGVGSHSIQYAFTNGNGCSDSTSLTTQVSVCTGASSPVGINGIEVFPNPVKDWVNVHFALSDTEWIITLFDAQGRKVRVPQMTAAQGYAFDLSGLSQGVYFMVIDGKGQRMTQKLIKRN